MKLEIPDSIAEALGGAPANVRRELAVLLYQAERISEGLACELAGVDRLGFYELLRDRGLYVNYGPAELAQDLEAVRALADRTPTR